MNHLLGTSFDQGVQLQPVWTTYRQKKKSLEDSISKDSDQFLDELAKLHQDTVALARPHLEAAQSARLEEIFAERRQMVTRTRESTTRVAERAKTEAPLTRPPAKDANKGGGVQMNNSGGGGTW